MSLLAVIDISVAAAATVARPAQNLALFNLFSALLILIIEWSKTKWDISWAIIAINSSSEFILDNRLVVKNIVPFA